MNLSKKMINAIKEVDINEIADFAEDNIKDIYISRHYSPLQGWHYDLLLDENGGLDIAGPFSLGSMCMSTHEGTDIVLTTIPAYFEMDNFFTIDVISNFLNEDEKQKLFEKCLKESDWNIEDLDDGYDLYDLCREDMEMVEQVFQDIFEDKYNDLQKMSIEGDWDDYFTNILIEEIENTLNEIKNYADEY